MRNRRQGDTMTPARYDFRPMTADDLPLVRRWLAVPHVAQWWGNPEVQYVLVSGDLDHPAMDQYIVSYGGQPIGYLQCYRLTEWNAGFGPQPDGTRGIDTFIAVPDLVGRGHGSALLCAFTDRLLAEGSPRVVTDPDPANARAIRAYEKAGFQKDRQVDTPDGPALLMVRNA
jgi:aminoglycoside 6'-N-acetyltransferase